MKKLISIVIALALTVMLAFTCFAKPNEAKRPEELQYVFGMFALYTGGSMDIQTLAEDKFIEYNDYNIIYGIGSGNMINDDFCSGCTDGHRLVVTKELCAEEEFAVTDIIAVAVDAGKRATNEIKLDGITYYPVGGQYSSNTEDIDDYICPFNINLGATNRTKDVYLYFTKDTAAGNPVTDVTLNFYPSGTEYQGSANDAVQDINGNAFDLNTGTDGDAIYMTVSHAISGGNEFFASVFNTTASIVTIAVCGAVIIAVCVFITVNKKKKPTADAE